MGSTSGIGACAARRFAAQGATVVIAGRRHAEGQRLAGELGARAAFVPTDISVEAKVQALIDHVVDRDGRLDCLVDNAGVGGTPGGVATLDMDRFWHTVASIQPPRPVSRVRLDAEAMKAEA